MTDHDPGSVAGLAAVLAARTASLLPDPARAARMGADLDTAFAGDARPVDAASAAEVEAVARRTSRHVLLEVVPGGGLDPDDGSAGWPPVDPAGVLRRGAGVGAVTRRDDGTGVLVLDALEDAALATPFLDAAFALLHRARAVVLDLRGNGGGEPATVALVMSWFAGPRQRHYADVVSSAGVRQWWTTARPAERSLPAGTPVAVLTGPGTFSSAEALAFFLRSSGRVRVVGERTRGAADHVVPVSLTSSVRAHVPVAWYVDAVRGGSWEGTGVLPDVPVPAEEALEAAVAGLLHGR
ncbi:hypothetical protein NUM3379_26130 [Kineococcus sp. NUM-3379]